MWSCSDLPPWAFLSTPSMTLEFQFQCRVHVGPQIWNELDDKLKMSHSIFTCEEKPKKTPVINIH